LEAENRRLQDALASSSDTSSRTAVETQAAPDTFFGDGAQLQLPITSDNITADNGHVVAAPLPARTYSVQTHSSVSPASALAFPAMMMPPLQSPTLDRIEVAKEAAAIDKVTAEDLVDSSRNPNHPKSAGRSATFMGPWLGRGAGAMHIIDASTQPEVSCPKAVSQQLSPFLGSLADECGLSAGIPS
jgi:hypothetical protein